MIKILLYIEVILIIVAFILFGGFLLCGDIIMIELFIWDLILMLFGVVIIYKLINYGQDKKV